MNWTHNNKNIYSHDDLTDDVIGFIYLITYSDGTRYLGKKLIRSERRLKPTKKQLAIRKNYKRVEVKDLPFTKYDGSNKTVKVIAKKEMIELCSNKINLTYAEMKHQVMCNVLTDEMYLNENIGGRFFVGKITSEVIYDA